MSNKNEKHRSMREDLFNATLVALLATGSGYLSKKVFGDSLDTPTTLNGWIRFETAIALGVMSLNLLRHCKFMPSILNFKRT